MKARNGRRLSLENLESRYALATAVLSGGNLTVSELSAAADLLIEQTAANTWAVSSGGVAITGSPFANVTGNITVRTGSADDLIEIDLNGFAAPKNLVISAGGGANTIAIHDGTITKTLDIKTGSGSDDVSLTNVSVGSNTSVNLGHGVNFLDIVDSNFEKYALIITGSGNDDVTIGDGLTPVTFGGSLTLLDYGGANDALEIEALVEIDGTLSTDNWNEVVLVAGAEVHGNVYYNGGFNVLNELIVQGTIDGHLLFIGNKYTDLLTLEAGSVVGRSVSASLGAGNDVATFAGTIGASLNLDASSGNDTVYLGGNIANRVTVLLGSGADTLYYTGEIGVAPSTSSRLTIDAGSGNDRVEIEATGVVNGQMNVNMGSDNDVLVLVDGATVTSAFVNGGSGSGDEYYTSPRANVVDILFEIFGLTPPL